MLYATAYTASQAISAITAGMTRNQKYANGVTTSATTKVTSSARPRVFRRLPRETTATDTITNRAWSTHDAIFSSSQLMGEKVAGPSGIG
jgi:hypothetical protein